MSGNLPTKRRGRPPKGPSVGKGANFASRITGETRAALDAEAERSGRSVSQVAEQWLLLGHGLNAGNLAGEIQMMLRLEAVVRKEVADPMRSLFAQEVLRSGMRIIAGNALPEATDETPAGGAALAAVSALRSSALSALEVLEGAGSNSVPHAVIKKLGRIANGQLHGDSSDWVATRDEFVQAAALSGGTAADQLALVASAMLNAETSVRRAIAGLGDTHAKAAHLLLYLREYEAK